MNMELAADYIRRRMDELGHCDRYNIRLRHLVLGPGEVRELDADNQLIVLAEPVELMTVESDFGIYDLSTTSSNELQYEHHGKITITNHAAIHRHLRFIQAIPKENTSHALNQRDLRPTED